MIRLLLDMGLARRAAADLRTAGLDVMHAGELGLAGGIRIKRLPIAR